MSTASQPEVVELPPSSAETLGALAATEKELAEETGPETEPALNAAAPDNGAEPQTPITPELSSVVYARISVLVRMEELRKDRRSLLTQPDLPEDAKEELNRQEREYCRLPTAQAAQTALDEQPKKLLALNAKVANGEAVDPSQAYLEAVELARRQWELIIERDGWLGRLLETSWPLARHEPLFLILQQGVRPPQALFGWAVYAMALQAVRRRAEEQRRETAQRLTQGKKKSDEAEKLKQADELLASVMAAADREMELIEETMVGEFWAQYQQAAVRLVDGSVSDVELTPLRAFLRYGMIGGAPWFLPAHIATPLVQECHQPFPPWDMSCTAMHVLYADEYLWYAARGVITPSLDEDLELNKRGSPAWKQDKAWRRVIYGRTHEAVLHQTLQQLKERVAFLKQEISLGEAQLGLVRRDHPDYAAARESAKKIIQAGKIEIARLSRVVERLSGQLIPLDQQRNQEAAEKLAAAGGAPSPVEIAKREAEQIHRVCRLCAKLKDPFPPLSLRENYRPETGAVNDRPTVLAELAQIEESDPTIFKDRITYDKNQAQRVYLRQPPYILLAPGCGFMSFSWNPRGGSEVGRLVIPAYSPRAQLLPSLLCTLGADFRWDTSRESAGLDLLTSDTLAAAYATVRWNFRKCPREVREAACIYSGENDRKNWRRHYRLHLDSAKQGGRKLYMKCAAVYEVVLRYMALPDGVQRLG